MKKSSNRFVFIVILFVIIVDFIGLTVGHQFDHPVKSASVKTNSQANLTKASKSSSTASSESISSSSSSSSSSAVKTGLPAAHQSDWNLVLVNRTHPKSEMSPALAEVDGKEVSAKIATAVQAFLAAAQKISPAEHLISGYRSVAYQTQLYNSYITKEMEGEGTVNKTGQAISRTQAIANVQTYSQPPGSSEHETGLAIDLSDVNSLDASKIAPQIAQIAPEYGFVLRFPKGKEAETGVDYEDWHFRYVGVANAEYMTRHQLTLEEYLKLLPE